MPHEVIRQRIKYLVEHGELYPPQEQRAYNRRSYWVLVALVGLNTIELSTVVIRHLL